MIAYPKSTIIGTEKLDETWTSQEIPIYSVSTADGLNQLVGYIKHINAANGTVLYRGQCKLYSNITASINHSSENIEENRQKLNKAIDSILSDEYILNFFDFKTIGVSGWDLYQKLAIEATLQHYGAKTYCVDFVDNHWTALWFGLYRWNGANKRYEKRKKPENVDDGDGYMYLFLYVTETEVSNFCGIYFGENTYTMDLRKILPSTFLRPSSQHGWIVRGKQEEYDFNNNIACVIKIDIELADAMLGNGCLLQIDNFFPSETRDKGYEVLLCRQEGTKLTNKNKPRI